MRRIDKVLVANRGEIALRVMKTCRRLGLGTVAVFSDADADAPHVRFADEAVRLGPAPSRESYLSIGAVLRAAGLTGADAVHPGYGFLSENADFAQACSRAGLVFVGPSAEAIRAMGQKREAKALAQKCGVPVVPGADGGDQRTETLVAQAVAVGLPVIFKPSAGGGGKGMRVVRTEAELPLAIESSRREAQSAFGDGTLIVEKYLERPRHVEVQVLADLHGAVLHLFERDCSVQRRHQKVVEETPSTAVTPALRERMGRAAVELAKAIGYTSAGTVEFLLDAQGHFYFSEMNTRLQVEHRVTELVVGVDLVEQQLRVARGEKLAFTQGELRQRGHAVECRLYAEDPSQDFLPSAGRLADFHVPEFGPLLVDSGVETGSTVGVEYDPLLAKLVAHGDTREEATACLVRALEGLSAQGVTTNRGFLVRLLRHPEWISGNVHTGFIAERLARSLLEPANLDGLQLNAVAATLAGWADRRAAAPHLPGIVSGFRNSRALDQAVDYAAGAEDFRVEYRALDASRFLVRAFGREAAWQVVSWQAPALCLEDADGVRHRFRVTSEGERRFVHGPRGASVLLERPRFPPPADEVVRGGFMAPMPGKVVKVLVQPGQAVSQGQVLVVLEAMKMEQATRAPEAGTVKAVLVREGDQVTSGQVLVVVEP